MGDTPAEQTIFEEGGVKITNLRAIISSKTYAMSNITSVSLARQDPSGCIPLGMMIGGALVAIAAVVIIISNPRGGGWGWLVGGAIPILIGFAIRRASSPSFIVQIRSASGEMKALSSSDETFIRKIVDALNEAIVRRG